MPPFTPPAAADTGQPNLLAFYPSGGKLLGEPQTVPGGLQFAALTAARSEPFGSGGGNACMLQANGSAYCMGEAAAVMGEAAGVAALHWPALPLRRRVHCRSPMHALQNPTPMGILSTANPGHNYQLELGNPEFGYNTSDTPVPVAGGHTFTAVTAGSSFACGLLANKSLLCWGRCAAPRARRCRPCWRRVLRKPSAAVDAAVSAVPLPLPLAPAVGQQPTALSASGWHAGTAQASSEHSTGWMPPCLR